MDNPEYNRLFIACSLMRLILKSYSWNFPTRKLQFDSSSRRMGLFSRKLRKCIFNKTNGCSHVSSCLSHTNVWTVIRRASFTFSGQLLNAMSLINNSMITRNNGFQESLARMNSFSRNHVRIKRANLDLIKFNETNGYNRRDIDTSE